MTTLIAYHTKTKALLLSDDAVSDGFRMNFLGKSKWVMNDAKTKAIGITGKLRVANVVQQFGPEWLAESASVFEIVEKMRRSITQFGMQLQDEGLLRTMENTRALIVDQDGIHVVSGAFDAYTAQGFRAIGTGEDYAHGAFYATRPTEETPMDESKIWTVCGLAMDAACALDAFSGGETHKNWISW